MDNAKMMKMAKVIDKILKVIQGFALAGVIVCVIFIPLTFIFKDKIIADASAVTIGNLKLTFAGDMVPAFEELKTGIVVTLGSAIIMAATTWYGLRVLRSIMKYVKGGRPFEAGISHMIKKLAWIVLIAGILNQILRVVSDTMMLASYDFSKIFNPEIISGYTINHTVNMGTPIAAFVILLCLSFVFKYGEVLQQESDETL